MNFFKKNKPVVTEEPPKGFFTDGNKAVQNVPEKREGKGKKLVGRFSEKVEVDESLEDSKTINNRLKEERRSKNDKDRETMEEVVMQSFLGDILFEKDEQGNFIEDDRGDYKQKISVTDIRFNGTELKIQDNDRGRYTYTDKVVTSKDVELLGNQVAIRVKKSWNTTDAILDADIGNLRFNFIHTAVSPYGAVMAVRAANTGTLRTKLEDVCEQDMADLFKVFMQGDLSLIVSGMTGSGKTQMQKMLTGHIPNDKIIYLIEDTMDSGIKELYPEKDIVSLQILKRVENPIGFSPLMHAGLRNNPDWLMISEVRGAETNDLIGAGLTGHSFCSTIHTESAMTIPNRMTQEITRAFSNVDKASVSQDISNTLKIGAHMHLFQNPDGSLAREVREVVEFTGYDPVKGVTYNILYRKGFEYNEDTGKYEGITEFGKLSEGLRKILKDKRVYHLVPKRFL